MKSKLFVLLLIVIMLGSAMRFYGLTWGLPYHFHSDENILFHFTEKLRTAQSIEEIKGLTHREMRFFLYGPLLMHVLSALVTLVSFFYSFSYSDPQSQTLYFLLGRIVCASFGVGTLILVYLLGKHLYTESVGVLACTFLAFTVLHVRDSHFFFPDVPATFFMVLTVLFAVRLLEGNRATRNYTMMGLFAGLGIATKQTALMVFPLILAAHLIASFRNQTLSRASYKILLSMKFWTLLFLPFLMAGVTYLIVNPFVLMNPQKFLEMSHKTAKFVKGLDQPPWGFHFTGLTISYWFTNLFYFGMGPLLEIVTVVGAVWAMVKRKAGDLLLLSFVLPYFYFVGTGWQKFIRYIIPLLPFLSLFGARFLLDLFQMGRNRMIRTAVATSIGAVVILSFLYSLAYLNIYRREDVRIQAARWIHQNIPQGVTVLTDTSYTNPPLGSKYFHPHFFDSDITGSSLHYIKKDYFRIKVLDLLTDPPKPSRTSGWWENYLKERLSGVDYIIMSRRSYELYSHRAYNYPNLMRFYTDLFSGRSGFQLVRTFQTYPSLFGFMINDDRAELTFRSFDHPKIMIYKRKQYEAAVPQNPLQ